MLKKILKQVLNDRKIGRAIDFFDDDIMLVSYPKSGNTWMRFLLGNVLFEDLNFSNMEELIPDIYVVNNKGLKQLKRPRIMKSHEYFDPKYNKIIYIVRDPRSVSVSYFHYLKKFKKISNEITFSNYLKLFVDGQLDEFGRWNDNVNSWLCTKEEHNEQFLFLKYEDLKTDIYKEMDKVLSFLNIEQNDKVLTNAIEKSSFESMKKNEVKNAHKTTALKNTDKNINFVRAGKTDEWKDYFSESDLVLLQANFGSTMKKLGYL